jgi:hypothetical protein
VGGRRLTDDEFDTVCARAEQAESERNALQAAIRKHRDERGDDRCWLDDEELYKVLPEGYTPPPRDTAVELANCERFIACRHNPATEYVSPQREIDRLRKLVALALREMENAEPNKHSPWCNGVHADNGTCEGEIMHARVEEQIRRAVKKIP